MQSLIFSKEFEDGDVDAVRLLLSNPSFVLYNDEYDSAIGHACDYGNLEIVKLLLADGRFNPAGQNNYPIIIASASGYPEIVKLFLADSRVDPTTRSNLALRFAVNTNHWLCRSNKTYGECLQTAKLLLADPRVNPKGEEGIYITLPRDDEGDYREIAVIDDVICKATNSNIHDMENTEVRDKFEKWLYRIGGGKYKEAYNSLDF